MGKYELNLGPFNRCLDYVGDGSSAAEYPIDYQIDKNFPPRKLFFMSGDDVVVAKYMAGSDTITVPFFTVSYYLDCDNTDENHAYLVDCISANIINMICHIFDDKPVIPDISLRIPIRGSIQIDYADKKMFAWVDIGIVLFDKGD